MLFFTLIWLSAAHEDLTEPEAQEVRRTCEGGRRFALVEEMDVGMRKVYWFTALLFLTILLLVWAQWPAYQAQLMGRAGWILLVMAAWWLAGRVLAGK